jgi:hypothetical protein
VSLYACENNIQFWLITVRKLLFPLFLPVLRFSSCSFCFLYVTGYIKSCIILASGGNLNGGSGLGHHWTTQKSVGPKTLDPPTPHRNILSGRCIANDGLFVEVHNMYFHKPSWCIMCAVVLHFPTFWVSGYKGLGQLFPLKWKSFRRGLINFTR